MIKELVQYVLPDFVLAKIRRIRQANYLKKFEGNNVSCNICGKQSKRFAPYGVIQRENAMCIHCGSLERHRLLWSYLTHKTSILNEHGTFVKIRLLHFAPERILMDKFLNITNIEYYPCDLFPEGYGSEVHKVDITSINFEPNFFDVIICYHVLEHITDDKLAMEQLYKVMKKTGWGIFQVPIETDREKTYEDFSIVDPLEREKAFHQKDHVRIYGRDYKERLEAVEFKVDINPYVKSFTKEEIDRSGFTPEEHLYIVSK